MENRRGFLKMLGLGVGAGAFALTLPQLTNGHDNPAVDRFQPGPDLLDRNMIYTFQTVQHGPGQVSLTANPMTAYRPYLTDLFSSAGNHSSRQSLLDAMIEKCLKLAMEEDTRGWTTKKWNKELRTVHELKIANQHEKTLIQFNQRPRNK